MRYINVMPGPAKEFPARLELRLTEEDRASVAAIAKQDGISVGELLRALIRRHIRARRKRQSPEG